MIHHGVARKESSGENLNSVSKEVEEIVAVRCMPNGIEKHEKMVLLNPDDYSSWNYLKAVFLGSNDKEEIKRQLDLTQEAIQINPKSYAAWFHRYLFFKKLKSNWFNEHKLCALLLKFDPRNFHCWNYCLKNEFEINADLHNPTSMHFKPFMENWLFIDPDDESVWRSYEKRRAQTMRGYLGIIRKYKNKIEVILENTFKGRMSINQKRVEIMYPVRRVVTDLIEEPEEILLNSECLKVEKEELPWIVDEVLRLSPECIHALKIKMQYTNQAEERQKISEILQGVDSMRKEYYKILENNTFITYIISYKS
ncbi:uncharacterized protein VICG_01380 [Vittaforma corneae ATCC 50505]|uniref:Uncharacterized protein n=1 Tax=Vittaforma corneae (strain ATCC 50505) TaxID=993615 RepID=L2GMV8_VITCO|nr:uncharacterized protein VICG_01380 [Vittaforma corneae ATCC 50505]ELA41632.1 hypothetical protein VICG_01380 [Vittaforma corneae ATCC 50505]